MIKMINIQYVWAFWITPNASVQMWCLMMTEILVNFSSGNGSLPSGSKALPEPMSGIVLWMRPANERRRYNVTFLIGRAHSQNEPWMLTNHQWNSQDIYPWYYLKKLLIQNYNCIWSPKGQWVNLNVLLGITN